jgi:hypothetical protein
VYATWYTYHRHEVIAQLDKCDYQLAHPEASPKMRAPDGTFVPVMTPCLMQPVPPSIGDLVRGRVSFTRVPESTKVNPYSFADVLLGRYTLGPNFGAPCNQSATTTDCSTLPLLAPPAPQSYVPSNVVQPDAEWTSATGTPISLFGFSFELPAGWHGSVYSSAYSGSVHALVQSDSNDSGFTIDCPPVGKGLEDATRLSNEARRFTTDGTDYTAIFEKWTAPGNDPWYFVSVFMHQSDGSSIGLSGTYCLAQGTATPDIEKAMRTMYESWK